MKILGVDLGSRNVKLAVFHDEIYKYGRILDTAGFYREYCKNVKKRIEIDWASINIGDFDRVIGTGYGRNNLNIKNADIIIELKAHTIGAVYQTGYENFTLLDVGGQDSKVIKVRNKKMEDMILNDKCAASCGRYLENMANVLGVDLKELEKHSENPVELNSTCAVFGESELIGKISEGYPIKELCAGVNYSLFKRILTLINRFRSDALIVTGGVAINSAIIGFIKKETSFSDIIVPDYPLLNGAIGCCAYYLDKCGVI